MRRMPHPALGVALLAVAASLLACGASPASPTATEPRVSPATDAAEGSDTVPCSQLIAPEALKLLLNNADATLRESLQPGASVCTWTYTPTGSAAPATFEVQVGYDDQAVETWTAARESELKHEPADGVVVSVTGLGDENYTWVSQPSGQRTVYARQGSRTLIWRFGADVLFLQNESGMIDYAERIFDAF